MDATRADILAVVVNRDSSFDKIDTTLIALLQQTCNLRYAHDMRQVNQALLQQQTPTVILLTDDAMTRAKNTSTWERVLEYVRQGGTVIAMGRFSSFVKPNDIKPFFQRAGLDWDQGAYHRTTLELNRGAIDEEIARELLPRYSQKALQLKNVRPEDMWYKTTEVSVIESAVFAPDSAHDPGLTAVALAKVGKGRLGYVGDVNAEQGSDAVILAMCKLAMN